MPGGDLPQVRETRLDTVPGQAEYVVNDASRIHQLWVEHNYRRMAARLDAHVARELARYSVFGFPTYFTFLNGHLWLYPIPDAVYQIGFIQGEADSVTITNAGSGYAQAPTVYGGGFNSPVGSVTFSVDNSKAEQKAIELLKEWLSPDQLKDYNAYQSFIVIGSITSRRYRIYPRSTFNVEELDSNNKRVRSLCFVPSSAHAIGDIMLAQKIMLEQREDEALNIANFSAGSGGIIPRSSLLAELQAMTRRVIRQRYGRNGVI